VTSLPIPINIPNNISQSDGPTVDISSFIPPLLWFHLSFTQIFMNHMTISGYGPMPDKPSLIGFQPPKEVIYTDRERYVMTLLFGNYRMWTHWVRGVVWSRHLVVWFKVAKKFRYTSLVRDLRVKD